MHRKLILALMLPAVCLRAAAPVKASLSTNSPGCPGSKSVAVTFQVEKASDFSPAVQQRLVEIWKWFQAISGARPAAMLPFSVQAVDEDRKIIVVDQFEILGGGIEDWTPNPRKPDAPFTPPRLLKVCLALHEPLPAGSLDAKLGFLSPTGLPLPSDLSEAETNSSLAGPQLAPEVTGSTPSAKGFVRELDLAGVLLSSVQDTTAGGAAVRSRTTKAAGDLFFAPILKLRKLSYRDLGSSFVTFFTPFALEAHASNQRITRDTLSQNRIVMGPEYELRWYLRNAQGAISDNLIRLILSFKSASDRDFKLIEPKFVAELRPVWGKANRVVVDPKWLKGTGRRRTVGEKIGRTLSPFLGFEEGTSYLRGRTSPVETAPGAFTRGYFGGDAGIDFNGRLSFSTTQTIYIRGERNRDLVHYMKNTAQWTLASAGPWGAYGVFVSFEKGPLPPFRSTTNSVNVGLRWQSSHWRFSGVR
ncbi:MAG TPA: hypothetical protein VG672_26655 [Bryobacteraceae bacterium]|nr:hypothetical protein [Bryobacteraceae bacterium]